MDDRIPHGSICHRVLHLIIIHDAQLALAESRRHRARHFCFRLDDLRTLLLRGSLHFLLAGNSHCGAFLCLRLRNAAIGFRLIHLQLRADIAADIDIRDINGENLKRRSRVKALAEHGAADQIRILQNSLMRFRRAYRRYDALADTRNDGFLARAADQTLDIRAHRYTRLRTQFNAVLRDCSNDRRFNDLRIHAHLHRLKHIAACQVDCTCLRKIKLDVRAARRNEAR